MIQGLQVVAGEPQLRLVNGKILLLPKSQVRVQEELLSMLRIDWGKN